MDKQDYLDAVQVLIDHDNMVKRCRDVSSGLAREVGDDFGGIAITPQSGLRDGYIRLIQSAAGDAEGITDYLIHEAMNMADGGSVSYQDGTEFPIRTPEDVWAALEHEKTIA